MKQVFVTGILMLGLLAPSAHAHGDGHATRGKVAAPAAKENDFGRPGDARRVTRTIRVDMHDTMQYSIDQITVKQGETIRFVVRNAGTVMHELVLGTSKEIAEHAELMRKFPDMEHDEDYQLHVKPGATGEMIWEFTKAGEFEFACLMPGHYEAGMMGRVVVGNADGSSVQNISRRVRDGPSGG